MKYIVTCNFSGFVEIPVEADNPSEAEDRAYGKIDSTDGWDILESANWFTSIVKEDKGDE